MTIIKKIINGRTVVRGIVTDILHEELMSLVRVVKNNPDMIKEEHLTQVQKIVDIANGLLVEIAKGYAKNQIGDISHL